MIRWGLTTLLFLMMALFSGAEELPFIKARLIISPLFMTVGDDITFTLEVECDPSLKVDFTSALEELKKQTAFELKETGKIKEKKKWKNKSISQSLIFKTWVDGTQYIPKLTFKYGKEKTDKELTIGSALVRFKSLLNSVENDIRDITSPIVIPASVRLRPWFIGFGIVLILSLLIFGIIKWVKRPKEEKIKVLPPWEEALTELQELSSLGLLEKNQVKEYYVRLSDIFRHYLEKQFHLMAPERTTEEFIKLMQQSTVFTELHRTLIRDFLAECDLVKFAKNEPDLTKTDQGTQMVKSFIEETKPRENPEEEGSKA